MKLFLGGFGLGGRLMGLEGGNCKRFLFFSLVAIILNPPHTSYHNKKEKTTPKALTRGGFSYIFPNFSPIAWFFLGGGSGEVMKIGEGEIWDWGKT